MDEPPSYTLSSIFVEQGLLYFILIAIFLLVTAVASASEAAFFALSSEEIDTFRNSRSRRQKAAVDLLTNPRLLTSVLTTWKYFMLTLTAVLSLIPFIHTEVIASTETIAIDVIMLVIVFAIFGVIVPKIYGSTYPERVSMRTVFFTRVLMKLSKRVIKPLLKMSFKVEQKLEEISEQASVEELTQALELAAADSETTDDDKEILKGIVNFGTLTVKQVMRSRMDISYADVSMDFHQLILYVQKAGYSRIPVCQNSLDKVEGVLYIKDLLPYLEEAATFKWQTLLRPGYFIPESKKIDFLLKDFQEKRVHIAIVVDEFGGTSGLITLEDVIEEIIGDINDEFDEVGANFQKINDNTYLFDGKISLQQFSKALRISPAVFDDLKGDNESLSGLLVEVHGEIPDAGTEINIGPLSFVAEAVDHKRIRKVKVHIHEHETR